MLVFQLHVLLKEHKLCLNAPVVEPLLITAR